MTSLFETVFGAPPEAVGRAHARANLLGEHTDYNGGFVLPTPLRYETVVEVAEATGEAAGFVEAHSARFGETRTRRAGEPARGDWLDYVAGCLWGLAQEGYDLPPLRFAIDGTVPMGAGISSSAALEVAVLRAVRALLKLPLGDGALARLGQRAENDYVGMRCSIMDQMVASLGTPGRALFLDTRSMTSELVDLPAGHRIAVVHCGTAHRLTAGDYNTRQRECEEACRLLGIASLRDLSPDDLDRTRALPDPLSRRTRHVMTENQRVLDGVRALAHRDWPGFGRLMDESHASQRDDYEVSIPEINALVEAAKRHGALGARLTGGGFGGSIVALVEAFRYADWLAHVLADRPEAREI
ncbi:MAG TPA: galactokinase [Alphaproteobacteria bacterium]|nr:galactokinase [Alphaproteobacteria bacterium]